MSSKCKHCGREIRWVKKEDGSYLACDPTAVLYCPSQGGPDLFVSGDGFFDRGVLGEVPGEPVYAGFIPHFKTCTGTPRAKNKCLTLPIKKQWFDMIVSGEKKEEYRQLSDYWKTRFRNIGLLDEEGQPTGKEADIYLRNGYFAGAPIAKVRCGLKIGRGRQEWGAWCFTHYYVLMIKKVYARRQPHGKSEHAGNE